MEYICVRQKFVLQITKDDILSTRYYNMSQCKYGYFVFR